MQRPLSGLDCGPTVDINGSIAVEEGHMIDDESFYTRFGADETFAEAVSSAASMADAVAIAAAYGYEITPDTVVQAALASRQVPSDPSSAGDATPLFGAADPGDY